MSVLTAELVQRYRALDSPSVSDAIETFDLRLRNEGFTDGRLRGLLSNQPPVIGYAVTARIRCSAPPPVGHSYHDRTDWWTYIASVPAPRIVVVQDVDEHPGLGAFVGDVHAHILQALGCVAYATNGTVRNVDAMRGFGFQVFASGAAISHAFAHIVDFGQRVEVAGLPVSSGDVLFGDGSGLVSVPPSIVAEVPMRADQLRRKEAHIIWFCRSTEFSVPGLRALMKELE